MRSGPHVVRASTMVIFTTLIVVVSLMSFAVLIWTGEVIDGIARSRGRDTLLSWFVMDLETLGCFGLY